MGFNCLETVDLHRLRKRAISSTGAAACLQRIDFDEAQALWDDPYLIEAPANVTDEPRFLAVGMIGARHWTAVYSYRSDWVRIISVRRARKQEIDHYEGD